MPWFQAGPLGVQQVQPRCTSGSPLHREEGVGVLDERKPLGVWRHPATMRAAAARRLVLKCRGAVPSIGRAMGSLASGLDPELEEAIAAARRRRRRSYSMPNARPMAELLDPLSVTPTDFWRQFMVLEKPVVMRGLVQGWPAVASRLWADWERLRDRFGDRLVSVEQGTHFYAPDATPGVRVPFGMYLDYMFRARDSAWLSDFHSQVRPMYLAQTDLFTDVPELRPDVSIPTFAASHPCGRGEHHVTVNAWLGRPGVISPPHWDMHHNILAQVTGFKLVLIWHRDAILPQTPGQEFSRSNISAIVDPRDETDPLAESVRQHETADLAVLQPGDALYIPPRFWHFCAAVDAPDSAHLPGTSEPSMSVNFWWPGPPRQQPLRR